MMDIFDAFLYDWNRMGDAYDAVLNAKTAYPVDIVQVSDKKGTWFEIKVALAGITKDEISVTVDKDTLVIAIDPGELVNDKVQVKYLRKGIKTSKMTLKYSLGAGIDKKRIEPKFENGILTVVLPLGPKDEPKALIIK